MAHVRTKKWGGHGRPCRPYAAALDMPPKTDSVCTGISPLKFAQLRRNCLEDLKRVKELWDDGVLTQEEFEEKKQHIRT